MLVSVGRDSVAPALAWRLHGTESRCHFPSLSPDPFFASLFSFLFVRDTNLAHPIKNCSLHSLVFVQPQPQTWIKEADEKKNAKMQDICNKETKTTAASLPFSRCFFFFFFFFILS